MSIVFVFCVVGAAALELLQCSTKDANYRGVYPHGLGTDFTVFRPVRLTSLGVFDGDLPGILGPLSVIVFDRATDLRILELNFQDARRESDAFAWQSVMPAVVLPRGAYSIIAFNFTQDWLLTTAAPFGVRGFVNNTFPSAGLAEAGVFVTGVFNVPFDVANSYLPPSHTIGGLVGAFHVGGNLAFEPVLEDAPALSSNMSFGTCEDVACADLPSGLYNVSGNTRFCDNDAAGGGWVRVWRANDIACEANGWLSSRPNFVSGTDPFGCRANGTSSTTPPILTPYAFTEVRGSDFALWAVKEPVGFARSQGADDVFIRSDTFDVWRFVAGSSGSPQSLCPCDAPNVMTLNSFWTCDRAARPSAAWTPLFAAAGRSPFLCAANASSTGAAGSFQRKSSASLTQLTVTIQRSGARSDIKLARGDLFVRKTAGFDKAQHCPKRATRSSTAPLSVGASTAAPSDGSVSPSPLPSPGDSSWIVPTIIATVLAVLLLVAVGVIVAQRRSTRADATQLQATQSASRISSSSSNVYEDTSAVRSPSNVYDDASSVRR